MKTQTVIFALAVTVLAGCLHKEVQHQVSRYEAVLNPAVGVATQQEVFDWLGAPAKQSQFGETEIWEYYQSYGTVTAPATVFRATDWTPRFVVPSHTRQTFDHLVLTFKSGVLAAWRVQVQR